MTSEKLKVDPSMLGRRRRVAVFGGSFNPIHNGHLLIAGDMVRQGVVDEVLFVPARLPPHKNPTQLIAGEIRLEMVALAIEPYAEFSVSDIELISQRKTGYTIDTLNALALAFTDTDLSFLIGMDSLLDIHQWYQASELIGRYHIFTYPRPGFHPPTHADLAAKLGPKNTNKLLDAIIDSPSVAISATGVRETAATGKTLAGLVPPDVEAFIRQKDLYQLVNEKETTA